jgi:hypothetical protein
VKTAVGALQEGPQSTSLGRASTAPPNAQVLEIGPAEVGVRRATALIRIENAHVATGPNSRHFRGSD